MKIGYVRRRTKIQIEEEKKQENLKKTEIRSNFARFEQMETKFAELTELDHNRNMFINGFNVLK